MNDFNYDSNLKKYWERLTPEERNMKLDDEALYSLCPQSVAFQICDIIQSSHIVDAFCGAGGMTIAFALKHRHVTAVDINKTRLSYSRHNADLFNVTDRIDFIEGNILTTLSKLKNSAVVFDPPWGGPNYNKLEKFTLANFSPKGERLIYLAKALCFKEVIFRVPRNFDFDSLKSTNLNWNVQKNFFGNKLLHYTIYANID
jgi:trimethylguanosine synthase